MNESFRSSLGRLWCSLMHQAPMWPMHGHYRCSICMRTYPVLWAPEESMAAAIGNAPTAVEPAVAQIAGFVAPVAFAESRRRS